MSDVEKVSLFTRVRKILDNDLSEILEAQGVIDTLFDCDEVSSAIADTNAYDFRTDDVQVLEVRHGQPRTIEVDVSFDLLGTQDEDKMFAGDKFECTATLMIHQDGYSWTDVVVTPEDVSDSDDNDVDDDFIRDDMREDVRLDHQEHMAANPPMDPPSKSVEPL